MADPFEVRMRFTTQLQHLNASTTSALKTSNYALRHAEFADDLHSCILEQLERAPLNTRANIMYFLPSLCDTAKAQNEITYIRMMERDILRIVDLVAPGDGSGAANVKVVRKVLGVLREKGVLAGQTVGELEEFISGRDGMGGAVSSPVAHPSVAREMESVRSTPHSVSRDAAGYHGSGIKLDKRQIEQRIEEDRERHKRAREGIWAVQQPSTNLATDAEFGRLWEEGSDVDDDDYQIAQEESEERRKHLEFDDY